MESMVSFLANEKTGSRASSAALTGLIDLTAGIPEVDGDDAQTSDAWPRALQFRGATDDALDHLAERQISFRAFPVLLATNHPENINAISGLLCL